MKLSIQAQHLQPGDIVGSGEVVARVEINSIQWRSCKVMVELYRDTLTHANVVGRRVQWGKYTMINVERVEVKRYDHEYEAGAYGVCKRCGEEKHTNYSQMQQEASNDAHYWWRNENANTQSNN